MYALNKKVSTFFVYLSTALFVMCMHAPWVKFNSFGRIIVPLSVSWWEATVILVVHDSATNCAGVPRKTWAV